MNIGILGGSFDPPHMGHAKIANFLLRTRLFDQIWLIPCYQHPFSKTLSPAKKRLEMTKLLQKRNIRILDLEIKKKTISYTIDTLSFLTKKFPQSIFSWIIGSDQVNNFKKWKKWAEILTGFRLLVIPRGKHEEISLKHPNVIYLQDARFTLIDISSSIIREKIKQKKSISGLVPKTIEKYIIQHGLYL